MHQAIADWDYALRQEFGGLITLTDVTDEYTAKHKADIVAPLQPDSRRHRLRRLRDLRATTTCPNVIVRSDLPPSLGLDPYSPQYLYYVTMHELGHALGLGHARAAARVDRPDGLRLEPDATASCRCCRSATSRGSASSSPGLSRASIRIRRWTRASSATTRLAVPPEGDTDPPRAGSSFSAAGSAACSLAGCARGDSTLGRWWPGDAFVRAWAS